MIQLQKSRRAIEYLFKNLLIQIKGFKFVETLQVKFIKYSNDKKILKNGFFNSSTVVKGVDIRTDQSGASIEQRIYCLSIVSGVRKVLTGNKNSRA